jgi:hypothetical protein
VSPKALQISTWGWKQCNQEESYEMKSITLTLGNNLMHICGKIYIFKNDILMMFRPAE